MTNGCFCSSTHRVYVDMKNGGGVGIVTRRTPADKLGTKVAKSESSDDEDEFPVGTDCVCSVVDEFAMDGVPLLRVRPRDDRESGQPSTDDEVAIGEQLDCVVVEHEDDGLRVQLPDGRKGFLPANLCCDEDEEVQWMEDPKFAVGSSVACRVWSLPEPEKIMLTCRPELVNDADTPDSPWEEKPEVVSSAGQPDAVGKVVLLVVLEKTSEGLTCEHFAGVKVRFLPFMMKVNDL